MRINNLFHNNKAKKHDTKIESEAEVLDRKLRELDGKQVVILRGGREKGIKGTAIYQFGFLSSDPGYLIVTSSGTMKQFVITRLDEIGLARLNDS